MSKVAASIVDDLVGEGLLRESDAEEARDLVELHEQGDAMTDPIPLVVQGTDTIIAFACGECHVVASSPKMYIGDDAEAQAREAARVHCGPWYCECGAERHPHIAFCRACRDAEAQAREAKRTAAAVAKAKTVPLEAYGEDMVYLHGEDKYIFTGELHEMIADGEEIELVWGCTEHGLRLDAEDIITSALEYDEHHEGAADQLSKGAHKALQTALDAWRDEYADDVRSWMVDYSVRVVIGEDAK